VTVWSPGSQNPTVQTARYQVRKQIRDGVPELDATPVPFEIVRLEDLSDQIVQQATPAQTRFQLRFQNVPLEQYVTVNAIPGTLVAYVDAWTPTAPVQDVDQNGNFVLPVAPVASLKISYGWQFFNDPDIDTFVDQSRQWLREYQSVTNVPDGLNPALISYASSIALRALARLMTLGAVKGGDADIDLGALTKAYLAEATQLEAKACQQRSDYWSRGPEKLAPNVDISSAGWRDWTPQR
jgi:hypothetical protein